VSAEHACCKFPSSARMQTAVHPMRDIASPTKKFPLLWLIFLFKFIYAFCFSNSSNIICRHGSFHYTSLHCTSQILHVLQLEGMWQPCIKQVYWHPFSNSLCPLHVSVSHFGNSCNISNYFIIIISIRLIRVQRTASAAINEARPSISKKIMSCW
jgi:hypothetical protein